MAKFVAAIDEHTTQKLAQMGDTRDFVIIGQNGEELIDNPLFLGHVDGMAKRICGFTTPTAVKAVSNRAPMAGSTVRFHF